MAGCARNAFRPIGIIATTPAGRNLRDARAGATHLHSTGFDPAGSRHNPGCIHWSRPSAARRPKAIATAHLLLGREHCKPFRDRMRDLASRAEAALKWGCQGCRMDVGSSTRQSARAEIGFAGNIFRLHRSHSRRCDARTRLAHRVLRKRSGT